MTISRAAATSVLSERSAVSAEARVLIVAPLDPEQAAFLSGPRRERQRRELTPCSETPVDRIQRSG